MKAGEAAKEEKLQLKNISDQSVTYKASIKMHPSVSSDLSNNYANWIDTPDVKNISTALNGLSADSQITVTPGETKKFSLTLSPNVNAVDGVYEGDIILTSNDHPTLHLPFVVNVGTNPNPETGFPLQDMTLTRDYIVTNGLSEEKTADASVTLNADYMNLITLEYFGYDGNSIGIVGQYANKVNGELQAIDPDKFIFKKLDGSYYNVVDNKKVVGKLNPGNYVLSIEASLVDKNLNPLKYPDGSDIAYSAEKAFGVRTNTSPGTGGDGGSTGGGGGGGSSSGGGSTTPAPTPSPTTNNSATSVVNQGQVAVNVIASVSKSGSDVSAKISDADLQSALNKNPKLPAALVVNAPVKDGEKLNFTLTPAQVAKLQSGNSENSVIISSGSASLALPVSALKNVPAGAEITVIIGSAADQNATFSSKLPGTKVLSTPISYEVNVVNGSTSTPLDVPAQTFVKRSFNIAGNIDTNNVGVLYLSGGEVNGVPATITKNTDGTKTVTVSRPGFSVYALATRSVQFTDIDTSWAKSRIEGLANRFLLFGTSDTTFSPTKDVTRAEFAAMLTRALGLQAKGNTKFTDIASTDWFSGAVAAASNAGLISGVGGDKFDPNAVISRQDLAVMVARALKLLNVSTKSLPGNVPYGDQSSIESYAQDSIKTLTDNGLISGVKSDEATLFLPTATTTREAAASVIYFLLQKGNLIN
ncbi:S-layer homology domain-containing protein [Paenibacillus sp. N1-5-1-14]|nr:S-layer homology domain-containing protein [Paenibacillus radicibacter]